ncbi:MAG TPA: diguanylate cyclase [Burkholderiaceae bacterium]
MTREAPAVLDEELRSLDASVEEVGGAALPAIQAAALRMRERDEQERLMWLAPLLARALAFQRQYDASEAVAKEALSHFRQAGSPRGQAMALIVHGLAHVMQGRSAPALDAVVRASALARATSDLSLLARAANVRAIALMDFGLVTEATQVLEEALRLTVRHPDEPATLRLRSNLSWILARSAIDARERNAPETAWKPMAQRAIAMAESVAAAWMARGNVHEAYEAGDSLALSHVALGQLEQAHAALDASNQRLRGEITALSVVPFHAIRARAFLQADLTAQAMNAIEQGLAMAEEHEGAINVEELYRLKSAVHEAQGEPVQALQAYRRFHELHERQVLQRVERMQLEARHDALTGLANRRRFDEYLAGVLPRAGTEAPVSLALIDVDYFKSINDRFGHPIGDAALRWVAAQMEALSRQTDLPVRLGGDEFAFVLSASLSDAQGVCERLRAAMATRPGELPRDMAMTLSIGIAETCAPCAEHELIQRADLALYGIKSKGRNGVGLSLAS